MATEREILEAEAALARVIASPGGIWPQDVERLKIALRILREEAK